VRLEHVVVRHAGGDKAAVVFRGQSEGKVESLQCQKCSEAALTWDCKSTVEHRAVEGTEGTPAGAVVPTGC
jgi:hypothetical protein